MTRKEAELKLIEIGKEINRIAHEFNGDITLVSITAIGNYVSVDASDYVDDEHEYTKFLDAALLDSGTLRVDGHYYWPDGTVTVCMW